MRKFLVIFCVLAAIVATTNPAWAQERPAYHKASLADIGKPDSGLAVYTNQATVNKIVDGTISKKSTVVRHLGVSAADTVPVNASGAIVKNAAQQGLVFVGKFPKGAVVVNIFDFPNWKPSILPALYVRDEGYWWLDLWDGNVPFFFGLGGLPEVQLRIFDPNTGELTIISSQLDFWNSPWGGIQDVYKTDGGSRLFVAGEFSLNAKLWLNHEDSVPEESTRLFREGIEINLETLPEGLLYQGQNLITIVGEEGRCDTVPYRYVPANN
jgi:hypothetical protein